MGRGATYIANSCMTTARLSRSGTKTGPEAPPNHPQFYLGSSGIKPSGPRARTFSLAAAPRPPNPESLLFPFASQLGGWKVLGKPSNTIARACRGAAKRTLYGCTVLFLTSYQSFCKEAKYVEHFASRFGVGEAGALRSFLRQEGGGEFR